MGYLSDYKKKAISKGKYGSVALSNENSTSDHFHAQAAQNVAVGNGALAGASQWAVQNVAVGWNAMRSPLHIGGSNVWESVAVGWNAMGQTSENSGYCVAVGNFAGYKGISGSSIENVFIGAYCASQGIIAGRANVAVGFRALDDLTDGWYNTSLGNRSMQSHTDGQKNSFVGYRAGEGASGLFTGDFNTGLGTACLDDLTTGSYNIAIGFETGQATREGTNNILIGYQAGNTLAASDSNKLRIGHGTTALIEGDFIADTVTIRGDIFADNLTTTNYTTKSAAYTAVANDYIFADLTPTPEITIVTVNTITNSFDYRVSINWTDIIYTSDATATETEVVAGLISYINYAKEGVTATVGASNQVVITSNIESEGFNVTVGTNLSAAQTQAWVTGGFTITLPASPSIGDNLTILDSVGACRYSNLTIARNSQTIMGIADDMLVSTANVELGLIFTGSDWRIR